MVSSRMPRARRSTALMVVLMDSTTPKRTGWSQYAAMPAMCLKRKSPRRSISGRRCQRSALIHPSRKSNTPGRVFVGPEAIELLAQHVGFEQAPVGSEEGLELGTLRAADGLPAPEQHPALPPTMRAHHRAGAKEFLAADVVERGAGVLEHVELIEHDLGVRQHGADRIHRDFLRQGTTDQPKRVQDHRRDLRLSGGGDRG